MTDMIDLGGKRIVAEGIVGVQQIDLTHVKIKYANGKSCTIVGTATTVMAKVTEFKNSQTPPDSA